MQKKGPFYDNVSDLTSFSQDLELLRIYFLQYSNSYDLISRDFIGSPHIILGKKSPMNL